MPAGGAGKSAAELRSSACTPFAIVFIGHERANTQLTAATAPLLLISFLIFVVWLVLSSIRGPTCAKVPLVRALALTPLPGSSPFGPEILVDFSSIGAGEIQASASVSVLDVAVDFTKIQKLVTLPDIP